MVSLEIELWNAEYDLSLTSFEVLHLLRRRPGPRIQALVEAAGLRERRADPDDRCSSIVEPTTVGRKPVDGAVQGFEDELEQRAEAPVTEEPVP
ncbi:hypothetical protein [Streptomyces sp. NPDC007991]|uniref:hypothetical protein n=1 Tax=Streptomyces sp. NPDC007991 TaxID=3364803 RepID=UPI0036E6A4DC